MLTSSWYTQPRHWFANNQILNMKFRLKNGSLKILNFNKLTETLSLRVALDISLLKFKFARLQRNQTEPRDLREIEKIE